MEAKALVGVAIMVMLGAMVTGWFTRELLLKRLREKHAALYAELGQPSGRNLSSLLPRHQETQVRFWKYLWSGRIVGLGDAFASGLAWSARIADVTLVIGTVLLLGSAAAAA